MKFDNQLISKQVLLTCSDFKYKTKNFENIVASKNFTKDDVEIFIIELLNFYILFECFQSMKHITHLDFKDSLLDIKNRIYELNKFV